MFYYLYELATDTEGTWGPLRLFSYITFRAGGAAFSAFIISIVFGPFTVRFLKDLQFVAPNRLEGLVADDEETKAKKKNVPSMGGILILGATIVSILLWGRLGNKLVLIFLVQLILLGGLGFMDDYLKVVKKSRDGLSSKMKLLLQLGVAFGAVYCLDRVDETQDLMRQLYLPFLKQPVLTLPLIVFLLFGATVVVGSSNAVNLSDGMDGLATGCVIMCALTYAAFAYICGHSEFAKHLIVPYIQNSGEVAVIALAIAGACLGYLWYNCHPASMFMGDTGSLALGGAIGLIAVLVKQEILLILVGGIFVIEAGSVILQVGCFKLTRKLLGSPKRLFKCAPIHHHFKMLGWPESQIVTRFWIIAAVLAAMGLATLKLR